MPYKIYHPSGFVTETESLQEVRKHQTEGCTYEEIDEEFSILHVLPSPEPKPYRVIGEAFLVGVID